MAAGAGVRPGCVVEDLRVAAFRIPTDQPESDGTLRWRATTLVVVELTGGGRRGLGYTYATAAAARLIQHELREVVIGADALQVTGLNDVMTGHLRHQGTEGLTACAVSAIDTALWDLKARCVELPLIDLLGAVRASVPVYGSGGFTSYDDATLAAQFEHWADQGIRNFKLKVGREPARDPHRVRQARAVIGPAAGLFVDGNGADTPRTALAAAARFAAEAEIGWFEQPLPPDDADGLAFVRARLPDRVELAAGRVRVSNGALPPSPLRRGSRPTHGRPHPLRWRHRLAQRRRARRCLARAAFDPLRPRAPPASGRRDGTAAARGVLPRSRPDRGEAVRWCRHAGERRPDAGPDPSGPWLRVQMD